MKTVFSKFICIIGISVFCMSCGKGLWIKGNGDLVTSEKSISTFEKIKCAGAAEVYFHASNEFRVVVTVDANLEKYVDIFVKNNTLHIGTKNECGHSSYSFTKYLVEVYGPALTGVAISGSGSFEGIDEIIASTFDAVVSGSGKINGTFDCVSLSAKISGSGKMTLVGTSTDANISISGSGRFHGNELDTKNASVHISGSGKATICVADYLNAKISGSGEIRYCGEPKIDSSISGSGQIRKM